MSKATYNCLCGFKTPYFPLYINHTTRKCGCERMLKICETERSLSLPIDLFIKKLIENKEELHQSHKIINTLKQNNKNSIPFYILKNVSFIKGWNNLTPKKEGDKSSDYKWSIINTKEFIHKYIEYYNHHDENEIVIDDIDKYIDLLIKQQ